MGGTQHSKSPLCYLRLPPLTAVLLVHGMGREMGLGNQGREACYHTLVETQAEVLFEFCLSRNAIDPSKREAEPQMSVVSGPGLELASQGAQDFFVWLLKNKRKQR